MDYYFEIDGVNTVAGLILEMEQQIDECKPIYLSNWSDVYNTGVDGYLVNIGYLLTQEGYYKYDDWKKKMSLELYDLFSKYRCNNEDFDKILNQVWNCRYDKSKGKLRYDSVDKMSKIKDIAFSKFPLFIRIANRNSTLIAFIVLCVGISFNTISTIDYGEHSDYWMSAYIGYDYGLIGDLLRNLTSYSVFIFLIDLFSVFALLGWRYGKRLFSFIPTIIFAIHCILVFPYILFPVYNYRIVIEFLKDIILSGGIYLFLTPIFIINKRRIYEYS